MDCDSIKKVLIIGSGRMGQQIGFQSAQCGFDVVLYDISENALKNAESAIKNLAASFVRSGKLSDQEAETAINRIETTNDPKEAGEKADLVSESVPEDPELKCKVFAEFNAICPPHTIFTTNTSSLIPSMIAESTGRPDRFAALHFHDIRATKVVDIMPHPKTDPNVVSLIKEFAIQIDQVPIVMKKENFGYVFNFMLMELLKSAQTLAANGIASVQDIDRAWMGVMDTKIGPFGIMDGIGIDTVWKLTDYWAKVVNNPQQIKNADFMKTYVDQKRLGEKSKKGFYNYPNPAYSKENFITSFEDDE